MPDTTTRARKIRAERIRWEANGPRAFRGHVGDPGIVAFELWQPELEVWELTSVLPGQGGIQCGGPSADDLKPAAEELLAEFVVSLGAVFLVTTGPQPVTSRCECGGLARHIKQCMWRQGYGSRVITPPAGEDDHA